MQSSPAHMYTIWIYEPLSYDFQTRNLNCTSHEEAVAAARTFATRGRVDLWKGNTKVGSFPPNPGGGRKGTHPLGSCSRQAGLGTIGPAATDRFS